MRGVFHERANDAPVGGPSKSGRPPKSVLVHNSIPIHRRFGGILNSSSLPHTG